MFKKSVKGNTFTAPLMTGIVLKMMLENHLEIVLGT